MPRLNAALAACQQMAQQFIATNAVQAPIPFKRGDLVLITSTPKEKAHKFAPRWPRPYEVTGIPQDVQVQYWEDEQD